MSKKNNKGFSIIEVLIVSTVILGTLVFLYVQFINIRKNYEISFTHNTVPGLYMAKTIAKYMLETDYQTVTSEIENGYLDITTTYTGCGALYNKLLEKSDVKKIFLTNENISDLQNYLKNTDKSVWNIHFSDNLYNFIMKLPAQSETNLTRYRLIIEYKNNTFATIVLSGNNA